VVLLWVYYSSLILFVGAELTQAFAEEMGHPVHPDAHGGWGEEVQSVSRTSSFLWPALPS
jgi:membrane protein